MTTYLTDEKGIAIQVFEFDVNFAEKFERKIINYDRRLQLNLSQTTIVNLSVTPRAQLKFNFLSISRSVTNDFITFYNAKLGPLVKFWLICPIRDMTAQKAVPGVATPTNQIRIKPQNLFGMGNLNYISFSKVFDVNKVYKVTAASEAVAVESVVFTGSGLDDATSGGTYTGKARNTYEVQIDGLGTPDTFKWRKNFGNWIMGVSITGAAQTLTDGVQITFVATTGHTVTDNWFFTASAYDLLTLDSDIDFDVDIDDPIYNLYLTRFLTENIELRWHTDEIISAELELIELISEYP